jgi:hypothetical protein
MAKLLSRTEVAFDCASDREWLLTTGWAVTPKAGGLPTPPSRLLACPGPRNDGDVAKIDAAHYDGDGKVSPATNEYGECH